MNQIDILLATYNGTAYLAEQLDSIEAQTHSNWRLIARDDGSTDDTLKILEAFRVRYPDKVMVLDNEHGNLGLVGNFSRLMAHSDAPYTAFCDQDDVWKPDKLAVSLAKMSALEAMHEAGTPLLVFSDLTLVDKNLHVINASFWRHQGLKPERCKLLSQLLAFNVVTGCTSLMNRALTQKVKSIPVGAHSHDWWVALVAAAFGDAAYVRHPGVLYRQHADNLFGARAAHVFNLPMRGLLLSKGYDLKKQFFAELFKQAEAFQTRYAEDLTEIHARMLDTFVCIPKQNILGRIFSATKCGCWPNGILRMMVFALATRGR